ncbi:MAG: hypothetical protein V2J02_12525 [Pseudomonadales bacterium]|jgi:hypothetical protein|nr:hypothetical protein [Pseudomonadales bacterium]
MSVVEPDRQHVDNLERIVDPEVRAAYLFLICNAACLKRFQCEPGQHGVIPDVRFFDEQGNQPYAFIPNQKNLLFYFRLPAVRAAGFDADALRERFEDVAESPSGEWKVRLRDLEDARRLFTYVFSNAPN